MFPVRPYARPLLIVIVGIAIGWWLLAVTMDRVFANQIPALALRWMPHSADGNVRAADMQLRLDPASIASPQILSHASQALQRQPIMPAAARLLGLAAASHGRRDRAFGLINYAEDMSRRDTPTELWLIDDAVRRGDIFGALVHYDRLLRVEPSAWPTLFPHLNKAAEEPKVEKALDVFLSRKPPWARPFLEQFVPQATSPGALVGAASALGLARNPSPDLAMLQAIEQRLVALGGYNAAAMLYTRAHPATSGPLRNGDFEAPGGWEPFDWNLIDDPELSAERDASPIGHGQALFLNAANGRGGDVATQLILLKAGAWKLNARVGAVSGDPLAFPRLLLRCASDGRELSQVSFPAAPMSGRNLSVTFTVPADCPAEQIVLRARSALDVQDQLPWIDDITFHPVLEHR